MQVRHDGAGGIEETLYGNPAPHCRTSYPQSTLFRRFTGKPEPSGSEVARGLDACEALPRPLRNAKRTGAASRERRR